MLKYLQKHFKTTAKAEPVVDNATLVADTAQAETLKEVVTMVDGTETLDATTASATVDVAALQATVASLTEQLAAASSQVAELSALVEAAKEFKAAQEKAAAELKITDRTTRLSAIVGTEQTANLKGIIATMDDANFEAVVTAMSFKSTAEANSAAFKEAGVDGNADTSKVSAEAQSNRVKDYLKSITQESN